MRYGIMMFLILFSLFVEAQENYSAFTEKASEIMEESKDETGYRKAFDLYEKAFKTFPESMDNEGLYNASILASKLKSNDKAFQYLILLSSVKGTGNSFPGWSYILDEDAEKEYKNLLSDPRWNALKQNAEKYKTQFYNELQEKENEFYGVNKNNLKEIRDPEILYKEIRNFNPYQPKKDRDYSIAFKISDSAKTSFFIHLPTNYSPQKKYTLLFFLHGAVRNNELIDYQLADWNLSGWNRYYKKYADQNEVIIVFPRASKQYNWMLSDDGFFMIPEMLKQIKKTINIDDNKVFIAGHSNGATGSFSYLMKQPSQFAGFYGFNAYPKVFTGGTFVENIKNRSFINFSTDKDYYYPPNANDDFSKLMKGIKADYQEFRYNGFPHWFPQFDESEPAYQIIFKDLNARKRNPFPKEISWEFDDERYGNIDWISNIKLDTLKQKAGWHKELNFKINKWLAYDDNDSLKVQNVDKKAFDFPRKSGRIKAEYEHNVFRIETSNVKSFSINISPETVDLRQKVKVYVNGKLYFDKKINYNHEYLLENFLKTQDREQVWVNYIDVKI
ncbi:alpha/beta hydrolase-fold protein [Chryseobacterium indologenes]|uniref:alpha/beta hydrolase-fold protein n=1 Tax=Chryseobacterium indologenes TaxID=253 RepID=UPI0023E8E34F|nr:alpha/beta hydrolase-fold protein [Chryseobacterium indologenes]WET49647.1 alpha/beta hydrolase-fold protein [Chryseobacterium indologenes]